MNWSISLMFALLSTVSFAAAPVLDVDPDRRIFIQGMVNKNILTQAEDMISMAYQSKDPIYLQINSFGGQIAWGDTFIDAMHMAKRMGVKLKCYVTVAAASMAFSILNACDERYAFKNSKLLFHGARLQVFMAIITEEIALEVANRLHETNSKIRVILQETLNMNPEVFDRAFKNDRWWLPSELLSQSPNWLTVIPGVTNGKHLFVNPAIPLHKLGN